MNYSASNLVKMSAAQYLYMQTKNSFYVTPRMKAGEQYQNEVVLKNKGECDEMRGVYSFGCNNIYFCIDMIKMGEFYEIKMLKDKDGNDTCDYQDWYFKSSVLQCAFYKSLLMKMKGDILCTPTFRVKEGYFEQITKVDKNAPYHLIFGKVGEFIIDVTNPEKILDFYKKKVHSMINYPEARKFDEKHKRKEYEQLKDCFTVRRVWD